MKIIKKISLVLCILAMPVMLFSASVSTAANCIWLYKYGFIRYGIAADTGISNTELDRAAHELIRYWNSPDETFNITVTKDGEPFELFNYREVEHLVDVKALFHFLYKCLLGAFIYLLLFTVASLFMWRDKRLLGTGLVWGCSFSTLIMIILGLLAMWDFRWLFWQFHILTFTQNDFWLLDPRADYLIRIFPEGFWSDAATICSVFKVLLAAVLGFVGWRMIKKK
jgi:integral membrane protein (TIGR01906 family)